MQIGDNFIAQRVCFPSEKDVYSMVYHQNQWCCNVVFTNSRFWNVLQVTSAYLGCVEKQSCVRILLFNFFRHIFPHKYNERLLQRSGEFQVFQTVCRWKSNKGNMGSIALIYSTANWWILFIYEPWHVWNINLIFWPTLVL